LPRTARRSSVVGAHLPSLSVAGTMIDFSELAFRVEPMRLQDVRQVHAIDVMSFSNPWPAGAYRYELNNNKRAHYYVAREASVRGASAPKRVSDPGSAEVSGLLGRLRRRLIEDPADPVLGYAGFWQMGGETHISTIAVHPDHRRRGLGELLLLHMLDRAVEGGSKFVTLEVRESNRAAQELYEKYGFRGVGRRERYYTDNAEDALLMTLSDLRSPGSRTRIGRLEKRHLHRLRRPEPLPRESSSAPEPPST
ncbi:MAG: ribosomal protein S18-alanine N-acetyltransferase, partial [Anaerolineae bacterium]